MKNSMGEREFYKDMRYWEIISEPILKPVRIKNYKTTKKYEKGREPLCYCIPTNCSLIRGQGKFFPGISLLLS